MKIKIEDFEKGSSIIELVAVIAIFSILAYEISALTVAVFSGSNQQYFAAENVGQARIAGNRFVNEIRNATMGSDGSFAIAEAGAAQIVFYSTIGATGGVVNRIRYFVSNNTLYKGVVAPTGSPLAYNLETEKVQTVQTDLSNGADPVFYYYNGDYDGSSVELSQPVNVNQVKFARMNLTVLKKTTRGSADSFSVSVGSAIRSLKTNLGS